MCMLFILFWLLKILIPTIVISAVIIIIFITICIFAHCEWHASHHDYYNSVAMQMVTTSLFIHNHIFFISNNLHFHFCSGTHVEFLHCMTSFAQPLSYYVMYSTFPYDILRCYMALKIEGVLSHIIFEMLLQDLHIILCILSNIVYITLFIV